MENQNPLPLKVIIALVHSGQITEIPVKNMAEAISIYRAQIFTAKVDRPFIGLDDLHWLATLKFRGGMVKTIAIVNGEKVLGRAAGVASLDRKQKAASRQQALPVGA
jgi:hypothetical protein